MEIIGIAGCYKRDGVTGKMLNEVLKGTQQETETIFLLDYDLAPNSKDQQKLLEKLKAADVWILAAPTYFGGLSGIMKSFLDALRAQILRFDKKGDPHPLPTFKDKHYLLLTNCYSKTFENLVTGVTDSALRTMDKVLTTAGLLKLGEAVQTNTYFITELSPKKKAELLKLGQKARNAEKRDDQRMKRYVELFFIVTVMAFITMLIQAGLLHLLGQTLGFWNNFISFVVIFYTLLAVTLHFFTVVKHKRK